MTDAFAGGFAYEPVGSTPSPEELRSYWDAAMGLQAVDGLRPSAYLRELSDAHVEGACSLDEVGRLLRAYYAQCSAPGARGGEPADAAPACERERETDFVSRRIVELLSSGAFALVPEALSAIHERLFADLDDALYRPGCYKDVALQKPELILNGDSVLYADPSMVGASLGFAFSEERGYCYAADFDAAQLDHLSRFIARVWQVHPFFEGNTRTVAVFAILYLRDLGFDVCYGPFAEHAAYFRDALVRASYRNAKAGLMPDRAFLNAFLDNALNGAERALRSRDLMAAPLFEDPSLLRNVDPSRALFTEASPPCLARRLSWGR